MDSEEGLNRCGKITHVEGVLFICNMPKDHTGLPHCEFGRVEGRMRFEFSWWSELEEESDG